MDAEGSESKDSFVRRACDQCRLRKIRCDKRSPCSNCRSSQIICRSTGAGQKPQEPRRRVLISDQYERKIDLIEERLGGIEETLRDISISLKSDSKPYYQSSAKSMQMASSYSPKPAPSLDHHEPVTAFEGSSSLTAHSAYASQLLETAVSRSPLQMATPKMEAALSSLKQIVNMQDNKDHSTRRSEWLPSRRIMPSSGLRELPLPPVELVLHVLREIKEKPMPCMQGLPFIATDRLTIKCREVFFATEEYSDAAFIIANGCLYFIFAEFMFMTKDQKLKAEYSKCAAICRSNFETALANMSLLMPATAESIEALAVGTIHAIELSKPSFALTLIATASHLCQTLGWHRHSSMDNDSQTVRQEKINLFWTIYCIDKALSLRVGRASILQDYDISTPMTPDVFGSVQPWNTIYICWIKFARIQGRVYELLYSPTALNQSEDQRASHARKLAAELQWTVVEPYKHLDQTNCPEYEAFYFKADEVSHLALLALIYRAIPPQNGSSATFSKECIETARVALEKHQQCMALLKETDESLILMYFHWTILYSPFVPFIVLFCHVIKDSSEHDLQRLDDFVTSIQPTTGLSEAISKLHRLCQVLLNIARLYLEAKAQAKSQEDPTIGQEFDTYLTALGMGPALPGFDVHAATTAAPPGAMSADMMQGMEGQVPPVAPSALRNWFSGNQHMMGLLEEDLSLFDPSVW